MILLVAGGVSRSAGPAQANIRTAGNTSTSSMSSRSSRSSTRVVLASTLGVAAAPGPAGGPAGGYVVRPGDTLSGIAARLAGSVRGEPAGDRPGSGCDPGGDGAGAAGPGGTRRDPVHGGGG